MLKNKFKLLLGLAPVAALATAVSCTSKVEEIKTKKDEVDAAKVDVSFYTAVTAKQESQATKLNEYKTAKTTALQGAVDKAKKAQEDLDALIKFDEDKIKELDAEIAKLKAENKDASEAEALKERYATRKEANKDKVADKKKAFDDATANKASFDSLFEAIMSDYQKESSYKKEVKTLDSVQYEIVTNELSKKIITDINEIKNSDAYKGLATTNDKILLLSEYFLTYFDVKAEAKAKEINAAATEEAKKVTFKAIFGGMPYFADRMLGDDKTKERLVILLNELDCFTYFDYVNAFLLDTTNTEDGFVRALVKTRYAHSEVSYATRKHFFTDWGFGEAKSEKNPNGTIQIANDLAANATDEEVLAARVAVNKVNDKGEKTIRFKRNGKISTTPQDLDETRSEVLKGVEIVDRDVFYIDSDKVTDEFMAKHFKSGDLLMLAAKSSLNDWLDVTHCGYLIIRDGKAYYRNASSRKSVLSVVEYPLALYLAQQNWSSKYNLPEVGEQRTVPGVLVYRTLDPQAQLDSLNSGK